MWAVVTSSGPPRCQVSMSGSASSRIGPSRPSATSVAGRPGGSSMIAPSTHTTGPAVSSGGSPASGGRCSVRNDVDAVRGASAHQRHQWSSSASAARDRPEDRAGHDLRHRMQLDGRRHDQAEPAAASAQRVEQLGIVVGVEIADLAVRGEQLHGDDRVRRHAVAPAVEADPAAQQVADRSDGGRGPVEGDQAVRRRRLRDLAPAGAGEDRRAAAVDVDVDLRGRRRP